MQRADFRDYFQRLRRAQAAAEAMEDNDEEEGAAATVIPKGLCVVVSKSQPTGIKKRTKYITKF